MPSAQSTWWLFTLNSKDENSSLAIPPTDIPSFEVLSQFFDTVSSEIQFVCWSHEFSSRHHLQGCIQLCNKHATLTIAKACFPPEFDHIHLDPVRSLGKHDKRSSDDVVDDVIAYCSKPTGTKQGSVQISGPYTWGERLKKGSNKRKLADRCTNSPERMALEKPHDFRRWLSSDSCVRFNEDYKFDFPLKPWQVELNNIINAPACPRSIIWVYGPNGNEGKSTYAKKLITEGWFYTRGGKTENLYYSYASKYKSNIVFDYPRSSKDVVQYAAIEAIKDGMIESSKYEPLSFRRIEPVHVVVMANFLPKMKPTKKREWNMETRRYDYSVVDNQTLSTDRVKIIWCDPVDFYKYKRMPILLPYKSTDGCESEHCTDVDEGDSCERDVEEA